MEHTIKFAIDEIQGINFEDYDSDEFAIARLGFLSTRPNSHGLVISEDVLRECASSVLGKWVVAEMKNGDATTHTTNQNIMGSIPRDQEVEFVYEDDGYLRAYVDAVISKIYAKDYCKMFEEDNERSVSVEMCVETENGEAMNDVVKALNIVGVTTLGKTVNPSCPESDITFVRFADNEAQEYFAKTHTDSLTTLKNFVKERKFAMEKNYGKQHDESYVDTVETNNTNLDLELDGKEEDAKMSEIEFAAVNISDMWGKVYNAMRDEHKNWDYYIRSIYEEDGNKFAIIYGEDSKLYRLDFTYTEEGVTLADEIVEVIEEFVQTDNMVKFAEPENVADYQKFAEKPAEEAGEETTVEEPVKMSEEEMLDKITKFEQIIADKDNIIMEQEKELEELREFKTARMEADKACKVEDVMKSVAQFMDKDTADSYRQEGLKCNFAELDGWANKVKASVVDQAIKNTNKKDVNFTRIAGAYEDATQKKKSSSVWERL